jgi:hypothetical protein
MAPEQLRGGPADERVDVYALGSVLYEMLTGHVPHDADTPYEVAARVLTERVLPPSEHNPAIWPELEEVVLGAMTLDPADRYPDMRSFAGALRRAVQARSPSTTLLTGNPSVSGAGALGLPGPTPLARSLATRRIGADGDSQMFPIVESAFAYEGRKREVRKRRRLIALSVVAAVIVLGAGTGGAFAYMGNLSFSFLGLGGGSTSPNATATAIVMATETAVPTVAPTASPTHIPRPTATPLPRPTATPTVTLSVSPTAVTPCSNAQFSVTYTGGPSSITWTATVQNPSNPSVRISFHFSNGYQTQLTKTVYSGSPVTVFVQRLSDNQTGTISVTAPGVSPVSVSYDTNC